MLDFLNRKKDSGVDLNKHNIDKKQNNIEEELLDEPVLDTNNSESYNMFSDDDYNDYREPNTQKYEDEYAKDEVVSDLYQEIISDDEYKYDSGAESPVDVTSAVGNQRFFDQLKQVSRNGHIINVTGVNGSGVSTMALNLAYTLGKLGFKTLLIDFDVMQRNQHFLAKDNIDSLGMTSDNVQFALRDDLNSVFKKLTITRKNVHLLASGLACDPTRLNGSDNNVKLMLNILKREYEFIICDTPLNIAVEDIPVTIENSDDILLVIEGCNVGILNTINYLCNIEDSFVMQNIFSRKSKIIFNKLRPVKKLYHRQINLLNINSLRVIDKVVTDIADCDIGYYFSDMNLIGCIDNDNTFEQFVGEKTQYCDTPRGRLVMLNIINELISK